MASGQSSTDSTFAGPVQYGPGLRAALPRRPAWSAPRGERRRAVFVSPPPSGDHRDSVLAVSVAGLHSGGFDIEELATSRVTADRDSASRHADTAHHQGELTGHR